MRIVKVIISNRMGVPGSSRFRVDCGLQLCGFPTRGTTT
jgi:hypothetical protein